MTFKQKILSTVYFTTLALAGVLSPSHASETSMTGQVTPVATYTDMTAHIYPQPQAASRTPLEKSLRIGRAGSYQLTDPEAMERFYDGRSNRTYWMKNYGYHAHAEKMVGILEAAWQHGLRPADYHLGTIKRLFRESDHMSRAQLELIMTDAFVRYAQDLNSFRFAPASMHIEASDWAQMSADEALQILASARDLESAVQAVQPQSKTYRALQKELVRLMEEFPTKDYSNFTDIDLKRQLIRPGERHHAVPLIRERLGLERPNKGADIYDNQLVRIVRAYQEDNGLEADGLIGQITLQYLNRTTEDKIFKLVANMERYRWMPRMGDQKFIMVNVPSGELWAIDEGQVKEYMPTIVGKPNRKTRIFRTDITGVRFNPDWTVPPTIKRFDVVPAIRRDVSYLQSKGMTLYTGYGRAQRSVDPATIDWQSASMRDLADIRIVQEPGDHNPLGRVRILMPNKYNIYLHDTNSPELFDRTTRQLSSGCMRMKYPERIARFVMDGSEGWNHRMIDEHLSHYRKTDIETGYTIPSYTVYYTTWIGRDGRVTYGPDVYGFDRDMIAMIKEKDLFRLPQRDDADVANVPQIHKVVAN